MEFMASGIKSENSNSRTDLLAVDANDEPTDTLTGQPQSATCIFVTAVSASSDSTNAVKATPSYGTIETSRNVPVGKTTGVVRARWLVLSLFVLYSMSNSYQWIHLNIIGDIVHFYWNASLPSSAVGAAFAVDSLSLTYMFVYAPLILPASYILNRLGLRRTVALGAALNAAGAWLKVAALSPSLFPLLLAGQTLCAVAQLFVISLPARLAAVWFGPSELGTATALGVFGNQLGCAVGFVLPPLLVRVDPENPQLQQAQLGLSYLLYSTAVFTSLVFLLILIFMRNAPPVAPSRAQLAKLEHEAHMNACESFKRLLSNAPFLLLTVSYGIIAGCFYALSTLLQSFMSAYYDNANKEAGLVGLTLVLAGVFGSVLFGFWLDKTKRFKQTTVAVGMCTLLSLIAFTGFLELQELFLIFIIAFFLGFFMTGYLPVGFEFAVEITYPEPEGSSSGLLNASAQLFGIALTFSQRALFEYNERLGTIYANALACAMLLLAVLMTAFIKADLKRHNAQHSLHTNSVDSEEPIQVASDESADDQPYTIDL